MSKKVYFKVSLCEKKTFSSKVVATSFLNLTVHRWIAVDVPSI